MTTHNITHGRQHPTVVIRSAETAAREEVFMAEHPRATVTLFDMAQERVRRSARELRRALNAHAWRRNPDERLTAEAHELLEALEVAA